MLEDSPHMLQVFRDQFAKHQVYHPDPHHKNQTYHGVPSCMNHWNVAGCIGQPKIHDLEFKQTKFKSKCHPMLVFRGFEYLMVSTLQVKATKHTNPAQSGLTTHQRVGWGINPDLYLHWVSGNQHKGAGCHLFCMQKEEHGHKVKRMVGSIPWQACCQFVSWVHTAQTGTYDSIKIWQATLASSIKSM